MKKLLIYTVFLLSVTSLFSQRTGISYQALIINPSGEELPGVNNSNSPLINTKICLEFTIVDNRNDDEYSETQTVTTDSYGMVNLIIGDGSQVGGYASFWNGVKWDGELKKLKIELDPSGNCSSFKSISYKEITSVPFALFAPPSPVIISQISTIETKIKDTETKVTAVETKVTAAETQITETSTKVTAAEVNIESIFLELGKPIKKFLIVTSNVEKGESCTTGGTKIEIGLDANTDGILNTGEIDSTLTRFVCNGTTPNKVLVTAIDEAAGDNCVTGGLKVQIGEDVDDSGTLGESEINAELTQYVCNGTVGKNSLVITTVEEAGENCVDGGVKIEVGIDANADGVLNDSEVNSALTKYICDGLVPDGATTGNTTYWNGTKWVSNSNLLFNDGTNVMIGTSTIDTNSAFTVASTTKGVMIPRLTKVQRDAIETPSTSLLIFQSDNTPGYYYYDGTVWKYLTNITSGTTNTSSGSSNLTLIYLSSF